jgi:hypothetical protein
MGAPTVADVNRLTADASDSALAWLAMRSPGTVPERFAPFHTDLVALPNPGERQGRIVFRSAAKTTLVHGTAVWAIDTGQTRGVLIIRANASFCRQSRDAIERLALLSGLPVEVRHNDDLAIISGTPVWTKSPKAATRGVNHTNRAGEVVRPDLIIVDDLEDDESARSMMQTERLERYLTRVVIPTASTKYPARVVVLGTPLSPTALVSKIIRREPPFDTWLPPMVVPYMVDGAPSWRQTFDPELEANTADDVFATEYQLHPLPPKSLVFPPDRTLWLRTLPAMRVKIGVDPATGDGKDRTGIVATGLAPGGLHVVDAVCWDGDGEEAPGEVAAMVARLQADGHVVAGVTVEAVGGFKFLAKHVARAVAPIPVTYGNPKTGKLERAQELTRWHKKQALIWSEHLRGSALDVETHSWTRNGQTVTGHDDTPDALCWSARATTDGWRVQPPADTTS